MSIEVAQMDAVGRLGVAIKRIAQKDAEINRLRTALSGLLYRYRSLVNSGDCGFWDPETERAVIEARFALEQKGEAE